MDMTPVWEMAGAAWPPLLAGVVVWPAAWFSRIGRADRAHAPVKRDRSEPYWVAPVLFSGASVLMHMWFKGGLEFAPASADGWRWYVALAAGLLGLVSAMSRSQGVGRWLVRAGVLAGVGFVSARPLVQHLWKGEDFRVTGSWGVGEAIGWIALFVLATMLAWWLIERVTDRTRGVSGPGVVCAWLGAASIVVALGLSNINAAKPSVVLAAAVGAAIPVALWRPRLTLAFGGASVPVVVAASAVFQAIVLSLDATAGKTVGMVLLLLLAAALPLVADLPPLARQRDGTRTFARAVLAAVGVALCAGAAATWSPPLE